MSVSIDVSNLEAVKDFAFFLEVMKNPSALDKQIKEAQAAVEEYKKYLGPVQTKEKADQYLADAQETVKKWAKEDEEKQVAFDVECAKKEAKIKEREAGLEAYAKTLDAKAATLDEIQKKVEADKSNTSRALAAAQQAQGIIEAKLSSISVKEQELDEKLATVKKMLGA